MLSDAKRGGVASAALLALPRAVVANKSREMGRNMGKTDGKLRGGPLGRTDGQLRGGPQGGLMGS